MSTYGVTTNSVVPAGSDVGVSGIDSCKHSGGFKMWLICAFCDAILDPDEAIRMTAEAIDGVLREQHMSCLSCVNRMGFLLPHKEISHGSS